MFTGIIKTTGTVRSITDQQLTVETPLVSELKKGSSIAVNGVCLTATGLESDSFSADYMPETARQTTIGSLKKGDLVNLELAMGVTDRFEGHMVTGHAEGMGTIEAIEDEGNAKRLTVRIPKELTEFVILRGSITLSGISLTVADLTDDLLTVSVIPHTWEETNLHTKAVGDKINVETDLIAKYIKQLTTNH